MKVMFVMTKQEDHKSKSYRFIATKDELMRSICYSYRDEPLQIGTTFISIAAHQWPMFQGYKDMFSRQSEGSHFEGFESTEEKRDGRQDWHLLLRDSRIRKKKTRIY